MFFRPFPARLLWLVLALGALVLAGCQADAAEPTPGNGLQDAVRETPTAEPTQEVSQATAAVNPSDATENDAPGETEATATTPAEESEVANADVEFVRAMQAADGTWRFEVTVRHPDTGWEDYADGWDVVTEDGRVLKRNEDDPFTRLLTHPHENEQPFTRSQSGLTLPDGVTAVVVRAHDMVNGFGGREVRVDLTATSGADFEVIRE